MNKSNSFARVYLSPLFNDDTEYKQKVHDVLSRYRGIQVLNRQSQYTTLITPETLLNFVTKHITPQKEVQKVIDELGLVGKSRPISKTDSDSDSDSNQDQGSNSNFTKPTNRTDEKNYQLFQTFMSQYKSSKHNMQYTFSGESKQKTNDSNNNDVRLHVEEKQIMGNLAMFMTDAPAPVKPFLAVPCRLFLFMSNISSLTNSHTIMTFVIHHFIRALNDTLMSNCASVHESFQMAWHSTQQKWVASAEYNEDDLISLSAVLVEPMFSGVCYVFNCGNSGVIGLSSSDDSQIKWIDRPQVPTKEMLGQKYGQVAEVVTSGNTNAHATFSLLNNRNFTEQIHSTAGLGRFEWQVDTCFKKFNTLQHTHMLRTVSSSSRGSLYHLLVVNDTVATLLQDDDGSLIHVIADILQLQDLQSLSLSSLEEAKQRIMSLVREKYETHPTLSQLSWVKEPALLIVQLSSS